MPCIYLENTYIQSYSPLCATALFLRVCRMIRKREKLKGYFFKKQCFVEQLDPTPTTKKLLICSTLKQKKMLWAILRVHRKSSKFEYLSKFQNDEG